MIVPVNGIYPKLHQTVWVAPTATIIGDVEIGEKSSIWFGTVIRGDVFPIKIGREVNIQDNCTLHGTYDRCGVVLEDRVTVGHKVTLHGCHVKQGALIGMGAIVMDLAVIGKHCLVAAGSVVTEKSQFEDGVMIMGAPAKIKRKLTADELKNLEVSADNYLKYTGWYTGKGGRIP